MADTKPGQTSTVSGVLWGTKAQDWADIQEAAGSGAYDPVMQRAGVEAMAHTAQHAIAYRRATANRAPVASYAKILQAAEAWREVRGRA